MIFFHLCKSYLNPFLEPTSTSNKGKQLEPLLGLELKKDQLRVRCTTHYTQDVQVEFKAQFLRPQHVYDVDNRFSNHPFNLSKLTNKHL